MNEDESCEGCVMFEDKGSCYIIKAGKDKDCPCRTCLIKVMCNVGCELIREYCTTEGVFVKRYKLEN